jgi:hypothetical protein
MAQMEDRLKALESRKRPRSQETSELTLPPEDPTAPTRLSEAPLLPGSSRGSPSHHQTHERSSTEPDNSDFDPSSTDTVTYYCYKRQRFTRGIKITPSYTLQVSSSL